jgi:hypothetical protein
MKKLYLLLLVVFACGVSIAGKWDGAQRYYDNQEIGCTVALPKGIAGTYLLWQLTTPYGRVMAQGRVTGKDTLKIPLKFDKLKSGISLKLSLQIKLARKGKVIAEQRIIVYSKKIFADIAGKLKEMRAGAILAEDKIAYLNTLGFDLPEKPLNSFEDPVNKVIFCSAENYLDNINMLSELMKRGLTLVMFAPGDESKMFLPLKDFSKISLISSRKAKIKGNLSVISNKEKIVITCADGLGSLVELEYGKGKIIIVADSIYRTLDKTPDAALILKKSLTK